MIEYTVKVYAGGDKYWYLNGKLHREDGPAVEYADGSKYWFLNGKYHREDGPALEYTDGYKLWYLNGKHLTQEEHQSATNPTKELTIADIERLLGHRIKIVK